MPHIPTPVKNRARPIVTHAVTHAKNAHQAVTTPLYRALNERIFPVIVAYATHPLTIALTILLLIPLILDASNTALALVLGNYTNVCSAAVSCIVLMQSMKHHKANQARHDEHAETLQKIVNHHEQHKATLAALKAQVEQQAALIAQLQALQAAAKPSSHHAHHQDTTDS